MFELNIVSVMQLGKDGIVGCVEESSSSARPPA
jgi:hypothetical protein